jgi:hypothetical protein
MEVGQVGDTQAVQLGRQAGDREVADAEPDPAGLEPAPPRTDRQESDEAGADERRPRQIWSFSRIGLTDTTWRLNFSSASSSPAATPTSCDRWRIGMP